jgi:hypothetical protein
VERISRQVIRTQDTKMQNHVKTLAFFLTAGVLLVPPAAAQHSKAAADYLIVEHTDQLLIYNNYQQRITPKEKKGFIPFIPLRVLEVNGVLNDNYTLCMKVELNGGIFYLIKNDAVSFMGTENLGFNHIYKNVVPLQDTVQLTTMSGTDLISPDKTQRFVLQKKENLIRYFQDGSLTYLRPLFKTPHFGWARLGRAVRAIAMHSKEEKPGTQQRNQDKTLDRVELKFKEVNTVLANIFMYFNKQSNEKKPIPQWHAVESERSAAYVLEPELYSSSFPETDRYLTRDLDNILLGTLYIVSYTPGKIEIQQK